jgi:hypothetical protein
MSHPSTGGIAVFGVGKYRQTADRLVSFFTGTPFQVCGMLDTASPEPYNFTPDRLRLVLRAVYPRPRVFIAGEAIEKEENEAAIEVWKEFVAEDGIEKPLLFNVSYDLDAVCGFCGRMPFADGNSCARIRRGGT